MDNSNGGFSDDSDGISNTRRPAGAGLLRHPELWRAGQLTAQKRRATSSGFPELDAHLPGGGWPEAGLSELLLPTAGIGELKLLMPLLRALSEQMRWIAWVNAPFVPYAPALEGSGVDIDKVLLIHPKTHADSLWALERAARSGTCSLVLAWLDEQQPKLADTRRLQLAAKRGNTLICLFRPAKAALQPSMAELRLELSAGESAAAGGLSVTVLKRRGGWPVAGLELAFAMERSRAEIRERLSLWRFWRMKTRPAGADRGPLSEAPRPAAGTADSHVTH